MVKVNQIIKLRFNSEYLIWMEFASSGTLFNVIVRKGAQTDKVTKNLFSDTFRAMSYMHSVPVVHRDMKLENILLDKNGRPKITDFSYDDYCGSTNHEMVLLKTFCGTTPYMPSEMDKNLIHHLLQIYSLWGFVWTSFSMELFLQKSDGPETMSKLKIGSYISMKPKYDGILSADIKDLIKSTLQSESNKRITMNNVLFHPWIKAIFLQKKSSSLRK